MNIVRALDVALPELPPQIIRKNPPKLDPRVIAKEHIELGNPSRGEEQRIEKEWEAHLGPRRMRQLREALTLLREITDPYRDEP